MATATEEKSELQLIDLEELEQRLDKCRGLLESTPSAMRRAVLIAQAARMARAYIGRNIRDLADLQGSALGFVTDRKGEDRYTEAELLDPLTEAAILGLPFVGNCVNVIAGRLYVPVAGWEFRYRTHPDFSWPDIHLGELEEISEARYVDLPEEKWYQANGRTVKQRSVQGIARVECWATCTFRGVEVRVEFFDESKSGGLDERIAIKVNRGMTDDAVLGKTRARLYKALWRKALGVTLPAGHDPDDDAAGEPKDTVTATAKASDVAKPVAAAAVETQTSDPAEPSQSPEITPGSFAEYEHLMARAGTIKVAAEIRDQYRFSGEFESRANDIFAARKADLRAQQ